MHLWRRGSKSGEMLLFLDVSLGWGVVDGGRCGGEVCALCFVSVVRDGEVGN
jgi:hypothetical protein